MAVTKKTLVAKDKRGAAQTAATPALRTETVAAPKVSSMHQIVAKKLAVGKLVTAKGIR